MGDDRNGQRGRAGRPGFGGMVLAAMAGALLAAPALGQAVNSPSDTQYGAFVTSAVEDLGGTHRYSFELQNTTDLATGDTEDYHTVGWMLPIFDPNDVRNVNSPPGWDYEIIATGSSSPLYNNDQGAYGQFSWADYDQSIDQTLLFHPDAYGDDPTVFITPPFVVHWYTEVAGTDLPGDPIDIGDYRQDFSFESDYGATGAPYLSTWFFRRPRQGDPPSPNDQVFGIVPASPGFYAAQNHALPEPFTAGLSLLGVGSVVLAATRRRRAA